MCCIFSCPKLRPVSTADNVVVAQVVSAKGSGGRIQWGRAGWAGWGKAEWVGWGGLGGVDWARQGLGGTGRGGVWAVRGQLNPGFAPRSSLLFVLSGLGLQFSLLCLVLVFSVVHTVPSRVLDTPFCRRMKHQKKGCVWYLSVSFESDLGA